MQEHEPKTWSRSLGGRLVRPDESQQKSDLLQRLPVQLLGMIFPPERVIISGLVCKWMRRELLSPHTHVGKVDLCGPGGGDVTRSRVKNTLRSVSQATVNIRWEPCGVDSVFFELLCGMTKATSKKRLGNHFDLRQLDLSNNLLEAEAASRLAYVLSESRSLTHLNLSNTCRGLTSSLRHCPALLHLDLRNNDIRDAAVERLAAGLSHCS
eukprot:3934502-Rhodomonas_salina.1